MKKAARIFLALLAVTALSYFAFRNMILRSAAVRVAERVERDYGFQLSLNGIRMTGLATVHVDKLELLPVGGDTLLVVDTLEARPSIPHILFGRLKMNELRLAALQLSLVQRDSTRNFRPRRRLADSTTVSAGASNYGKLLHDLSRRAFNLSPQKAELRNMNLRFVTDSVDEALYISSFVSGADSLYGEMFDAGGGRWLLEGTFSQDGQTAAARILPASGNHGSFPLVHSFLGGYLAFDTLNVRLDRNEYRAGMQGVAGLVEISGCRARHIRMSTDTVEVKHAAFFYDARIGKDFVELDSLSRLVLNDLHLSMYARADRGKKTSYALQLKSGPQPATAFFTSLPAGMFTELQGVDAKGTLDFFLRFRMETDRPDELEFEARMNKNKFRLTSFGSNSLLKMNSEFSHTVYEYGRPVRTFAVGPSNPGFVPLEQVSPYLRHAILTSEDGSFFHHNGFSAEAFRKSIAANYRAGKFVRGGSTITMQLVKNVYLTRKKTIARKAEEAFIVWLIESNNLVSKERMFEVYLNIIELGPMVYGVKEASSFYFNKVPADLTLNESIFLASLLPHPKWFKYSFDSTGTLKPYFADYYRVVSNFMVKKNLITEAEQLQLEPRVHLAGPAKYVVLPTDTVPPSEEEDPD